MGSNAGPIAGSASDHAGAATVTIRDLGFGFRRGRPLLAIDALDVTRGEHLFVFGPSGSGKSTLLNLIAGTLKPDRGEIRIAGRAMTGIGEGARDRLRANAIGVIFQSFNLLPFLSIRDNVLLPLRFSAARRARAIARDGTLDAAARRLLDALGLDGADLLGRSAMTLSVGQQQRVAAARALIGAPSLVLADEPTSALDTDAREAFLTLLFHECDAAGTALLFVSHDHTLKRLFNRELALDSLLARPEAA